MSALTDLQTHVAGLLNGDGYFADPVERRRITVLTELIGDPQSEIDQKIAAVGISVVVVTPLLKLPEPGVHTLDCNTPLILQITETPLLNRGDEGTGKTALDVACEIIALLHGAWTGQGNPRTNLIRCTETPLTLVAWDEAKQALTYHGNFVAPITLNPRRAQSAI